MPLKEDVEITELESFEPSRVDGVGKGANGFPILMMKSVDGEVTETEATIEDVLAELDKAESESRPPCSLCKGSGKIRDGHVTCPKCKGSGVKPMPGDTEKSLRELAAAKASDGAAESGVPTPSPSKCPTCGGSGIMSTAVDPSRPCPDCNGTGRDGQYNTNNVQEGFPGGVSVGDPQGRETVDKSIEDRYLVTESDWVEKRKFDPNVGGGVDRDKIPAEDFAGKNRSFPIVIQGDVQDALQSLGRAGSDNYDPATIRSNIIKIAKRKGFKLPKATQAEEDATKQAGDGSSFTGLNPFLGATTTAAPGGVDDGGNGIDTSDDPAAPGSPAWEAVDAETATAAAMALLQASELIRHFGKREGIEVAVGEGNDIFDAAAAELALCDVSHALGIMAQMAFHEGLEAMKSVDGDVEKAGKRLSGKSITALAAARDHLNVLLGDDDPSKKQTNKTDTGEDGDDATSTFIASANKQLLEGELEGMTVSELEKVLNKRDEKLVGLITKALKSSKNTKGSVAVREKASEDAAHDAHDASDGDEKKETDDDLEDETKQGTNTSGSGTRDADGGAKALSEEEIEAKRAHKEAKKALKSARKAEQQATKRAALTKAVEEATAQVRLANAALQDRLDKVEKTVVPSEIVRTRPQEAIAKASERDVIESQIARYESLAKSTDESELRREYTARVKALRVKLAAV